MDLKSTLKKFITCSLKQKNYFLLPTSLFTIHLPAMRMRMHMRMYM